MMLRFVRAAGTAAILCALLDAPSRADDSSNLQVRLASAFKNVTSYQIQLSTAQGMAGAMTIVPPAHRAKLLLTFGTNTFEIYTVDSTTYQHAGSGAWTKRAASNPAMMMRFGLTADAASKIVALADTTDDGHAVGAYSVETDNVVATAGAPPRVALTCTYDKATFLNRTCRNDSVILKFSNYNDPKNVIELPDAAKAAPEPAPAPLAPPNANAPNNPSAPAPKATQPN